MATSHVSTSRRAHKIKIKIEIEIEIKIKIKIEMERWCFHSRHDSKDVYVGFRFQVQIRALLSIHSTLNSLSLSLSLTLTVTLDTKRHGVTIRSSLRLPAVDQGTFKLPYICFSKLPYICF